MDFINENMQTIIAAIVVLVLLVVVLAVWRAVSPRMMGRRGQRLGVSEYYELDKTRRLVLVRRDNVEHLVLIGGAQDVVIETGVTVQAIAAAYAPPPPSAIDQAMPPVRPAPRPAVFGDRKPPPLRTVDQPPPASAARREEPEL